MCNIVVPASRLIEAAKTQCRGLPVLEVGAGGVGLAAGRDVHPSHTVQRWERYLMSFCTTCGKYATVDGRHLAAKCKGISRKGRENLTHIDDGKFPRRDGVPKALQAALDARDRGPLARRIVRAVPEGGDGGPSAYAG